MTFDAVVLAGVIIPVRGGVTGVEAHCELQFTTDIKRCRKPQNEREPVRLLVAREYEVRRHLAQFTHTHIQEFRSSYGLWHSRMKTAYLLMYT